MATERTPSTGERGWQDAGARLLDPTDRAFWVGLIVVGLSLLSALATYLILTGLTGISPRNDLVLPILLFNGALIVAMIAVIAWQMVGLLRAWQERQAGARLHVRIVLLFSLIAALPAMLLAIAATTTFSRSLDGWFSARTRSIIDASLEVANLYVDEHGQVIRTDVANMARDIDAAAAGGPLDGEALKALLIAQAGLRDLPSVALVDGKGKVAIEAVTSPNLPPVKLPAQAIAEAENGEIPIMTGKKGARIAALVKLARLPDRYLYATRAVSAAVLDHLTRASENVDEYNRLRQAKGGLKLAHGLLYLMISITSLLAAIWAGMWFASRFVSPIRRLIGAAQQVAKGSLDIELPEKRGEGDLRRLSHDFNTMTRELKRQQTALVTANEQLLERRHFIEAVLSGVSAGVIGLDSAGRVTLLSASAERLLGVKEADAAGRPLVDVVPMLAPALERRDEQALRRDGPMQLSIPVGPDERTFAVRVTREREGAGDVGSVVTFDDITDLVAAQRTSAWADVARRIAHEIKNPLTPIILSAERIRRKYARVITDDRETFEKLTATIERQAGDIKTMVDEFASFARVPKPVIEDGDLREAVQDSVILFRESHPQITYKLAVPAEPMLAEFDRRLITQALTNLVKNATEAVEQASESRDGVEPNAKDWKPAVEIVLRRLADRFEIDVIDNGIGLPKQNRSRLLEPYVTTKGHKGTGLGLAIVQKITEQHGGALSLDDAPAGPGRVRGALVRMTLPLGTKGAGQGRSGKPATAAE